MICFFSQNTSKLQIMLMILQRLSLVARPDDVIRKLEENAHILLQWFKSNYEWYQSIGLKFLHNMSASNLFSRVVNSASVKILGVNFDNKLSFNLMINDVKKSWTKAPCIGTAIQFYECRTKKTYNECFY